MTRAEALRLLRAGSVSSLYVNNPAKSVALRFDLGLYQTCIRLLDVPDDERSKFK